MQREDENAPYFAFVLLWLYDEIRSPLIIQRRLRMEQAYVRKIEQLAEYCPRNCKFQKHGIQNLCKAKDVGLVTFVKCLEEKPSVCDCSLYIADSWFCSCCPRIYIAKQLKE